MTSTHRRRLVCTAQNGAPICHAAWLLRSYPDTEKCYTQLLGVTFLADFTRVCWKFLCHCFPHHFGQGNQKDIARSLSFIQPGGYQLPRLRSVQVQPRRHLAHGHVGRQQAQASPRGAARRLLHRQTSLQSANWPMELCWLTLAQCRRCDRFRVPTSYAAHMRARARECVLQALELGLICRPFVRPICYPSLAHQTFFPCLPPSPASCAKKRVQHKNTQIRTGERRGKRKNATFPIFFLPPSIHQSSMGKKKSQRRWDSRCYQLIGVHATPQSHGNLEKAMQTISFSPSPSASSQIALVPIRLATNLVVTFDAYIIRAWQRSWQRPWQRPGQRPWQRPGQRPRKKPWQKPWQRQ